MVQWKETFLLCTLVLMCAVALGPIAKAQQCNCSVMDCGYPVLQYKALLRPDPAQSQGFADVSPHQLVRNSGWCQWQTGNSQNGFDVGISTRWSQNFHQYPGTIDILYWQDPPGMNNPLFYAVIPVP